MCALFHWLAFAALLAALARLLTMDFTAEQALVGTLAAASTLPMALRYYSYSPYKRSEPVLFSIALVTQSVGNDTWRSPRCSRSPHSKR